MGINLKTISLSITSVALTVFISTAAIAASVDISYQGTGTSTSLETKGSGNNSVNAGLSVITVDGTNSLAVNTSNSSMTGTWTATVNDYAAVQAGAGEYNSGRNGEEKYAKAGYLFSLFSLLDTSKDPSTVAKKYNALINYVIWDIFAEVPKLDNEDDKDAAKELKDRAKDYKKFDWSTTMVVYSGADGGNTREFFAVLPPIATPIPSALFLFGSMALGLFGIATRKQTLNT